MIRRAFLIIVILTLWSLMPMTSIAETIGLSLDAGMPEVVVGTDGLQSIYLPGCPSKASPGDPLLPVKVVNVLLPPDVDWKSLSLSIVSIESSTLEGSYNLKARGPYIPLDGTGQRYWGEEKKILDGRNQDIYTKDAFYPDRVVRLLPCSQMRKWIFARVEFRPLQYNSVSGTLRLNRSVRLEITFNRSGTEISPALLRDCAMDHLAPGLFHNYESGKRWYIPPPPLTEDRALETAKYDYVIIISNNLFNKSTKIADFIIHKHHRGHNVLVVYDITFLPSNGPPPNTRADKIRQWLKDNYAQYGILYVLLVGDPSPFEDSAGEGDVPMKMCWPRYGASWGQVEVPTDHYFADLTGNWDKDGDQLFGEYVDWDINGGVDLFPDVYVGRIPVYNSDHVVLDSILQKIMDYQNASDIAWRKNTLLPMSFVDASHDGAQLAQEMTSGFLTTQGFPTWTMFQQGNGACGIDSGYSSNQELRGGTVVRDRWAAHDYGLVCWVGHGNAGSASVGYDGCWDTPSSVLMDVAGTGSLDNDHPSLVFQMSCNNGWPENSGNLGTALLKNGSVGTVCSSRESYWGCDGWPNFNGNASSTGIAYEYLERLAQNYRAGVALYQGKWAVEPRVDTGMELVNQYDHNLYGDPTVSLGDVMSLKEAVDNDELSFIPGSDGHFWTGQTTTFYYDGDAARSAPITYNESSSFRTTITGPKDIKFYWKVSSEAGYDYLEFYIDDVLQSGRISGEQGWQQQTHCIGTGDHEAKWVYRKDYSISAGLDGGWVDRVELANNTPAIPGSITYPSSDDDGAFTVSWSPVTSAVQYELVRFSVGSTLGYICYTGSATSYTQSGLVDGSFYYRVRGINPCGVHGNFRTGHTVVVCNHLNAPGGITYPSFDEDGAFTVSWPAVSGASSYTLECATNQFFTLHWVAYSGGNTSFQISGLADGTYWFRVRANSVCTSSLYVAGEAMDVCDLPLVPASIQYPSGDCNGTVTVNWPAITWPAACITKYYLAQRSSDPGFPRGSITVVHSSLNTWFQDIGLAPGTYYYRVRAIRECGSSPWRTGDALVVSAIQLAPANIIYPSFDEDGNFTVSWSAAPGANRYTVHRANNPFFKGAEQVFSGNSTAMVETGISKGTYYYRVMAHNECGGSSGWTVGGPITVIDSDKPMPWLMLLLD